MYSGFVSYVLVDYLDLKNKSQIFKAVSSDGDIPRRDIVLSGRFAARSYRLNLMMVTTYSS